MSGRTARGASSRKGAASPAAVAALASIALGLAIGPCASLAVAAPRVLAIDPARSTLGFSVSRPHETIPGTAPGLAGEVHLDPDNPAAGASVVLRVVAASLETGNRLRDRTMRGSHLEVETYPEIRFTSTAITLDPGASGAPGPPGGPLRAGESRKAIVEGRLALHGVERPLRIPVVLRYDNGAFSADGEIAFKLSDHAIPIPKFLWLVLDDLVTVQFHLIAG
jgi:polyisoprenoid-binding protein YceI